MNPGGNLLDDDELFGGGLAVAAGPDFEAHPLPLTERAEARPLDGGDVNEDVFRAVLRLDEAEALGGVGSGSV